MALNYKSQAHLNHNGLIWLYTASMSIGARIRQLREQNKLSGEKFGELCGVTKGMVSQWESDTSTPSTDRLIELRKHLVFSMDWLISGDQIDNKIMDVCTYMQKMTEYSKDILVAASHKLSERPSIKQTGEHVDRRIASKNLDHGQIDRRQGQTKYTLPPSQPYIKNTTKSRQKTRGTK